MKKSFNLFSVIALTMGIGNVASAQRSAPYQSLVCPDQTCNFRLETTDRSGNFAIYIVRVPGKTVDYGELVSLRQAKALTFVGTEGGGRGNGLSEDTSTPPYSVASGEFISTRYGNTLAVFRPDQFPIERQVKVDLCGNYRPQNYLDEAPITLPNRIPDRYSAWSVHSIQGTKVYFRDSSNDQVVLEFGEPVLSAFPVSALLTPSHAAVSGVFAIKGRSGNIRYFGHFGSYEEYYRQPDNRFSPNPNEFCRL